jgi:hypothetical protein
MDTRDTRATLGTRHGTKTNKIKHNTEIQKDEQRGSHKNKGELGSSKG